MNEHHEEIATLAHRIYEEAGYPDGKADEHWHRAEEQWRAEMDKAPATEPD